MHKQTQSFDNFKTLATLGFKMGHHGTNSNGMDIVGIPYTKDYTKKNVTARHAYMECFFYDQLLIHDFY